jgi:phage gpG-like protein
MIEITMDTRAIDAALARLRANVNDMLPAMHDLGALVTGRVYGGFRDTTNPYGSPWAALAESTIRKRRNQSNKPLNDTGRLMNSITFNPSRFEVTIGTKEKYGITHQQGAAKGQYGLTRRGTPIPWGTIPAREFLPTQAGGFPATWEADILQIIARHIERSV